MKARKISALLGTLVLTGSLVAGCAAGTTASAASFVSGSSAVSADTASADQDTAESNAADTKSGNKHGDDAVSDGSEEKSNDDTDSDGTSSDGSDSKSDAASSEDGQISSTAASGGNETSALLSADDFISDRDQEQTADTTDAKTITVEDGQDVRITEEGVYVISGSASDVTIEVNAPDAKVQLVLDGVSITNEDKPAIYVADADKVFVTTADGSKNSLEVSGAYQADGDTNLDAVIFSKSDLTLNGEGTLTINSAEGNGISGKDDLVITGGTYDITSAEDSIEAHDSITISDGSFTIDSGKDAFHSEDSDDDTVGSVLITGGSFTINADDDGIQGTTITQIDGGTFDITAVEAVEGTLVQINGGTFQISASDDGINAAQKSSQYTPVIIFNGGDLTITMGQGDTDAVDSNGAIYVNDGTIDITAQMSSFDYNTTGEINGGTVTVNGEEITEMPAGMQGGKGGMGGPGGMQGGSNGSNDSQMNGQMGPGMRGGMGGPGGMQGGPMGNGNSQNSTNGSNQDNSAEGSDSSI